MKRVLSSKMTVVALVIAIVTLITGVAWAATNTGPNSSTANQLTSSVVEITPLSLHVPVGGTVRVAGGGFAPGEVVLFQVVIGSGSPNVTIEGGFANAAGAFLAESELPQAIGAGFYTIRAIVIGGVHVASSPVIICEQSEPKCPAE